MRAASVGGGPAWLCSVVEGIDVAAGQTSRTRQSVCGRAVHFHLSDCIRDEVGFPTTAAGNIDGADRVNSHSLTGRADPCCLVRPLLAGNHPVGAAPMRRTRSTLPPAACAAPATQRV
jgi:2,4-dienoyl-CoA reductase-like NADH-dependent reductase (Old Yellow Enzyme family)